MKLCEEQLRLKWIFEHMLQLLFIQTNVTLFQIFLPFFSDLFLSFSLISRDDFIRSVAH